MMPESRQVVALPPVLTRIPPGIPMPVLAMDVHYDRRTCFRTAFRSVPCASHHHAVPCRLQRSLPQRSYSSSPD